MRCCTKKVLLAYLLAAGVFVGQTISASRTLITLGNPEFKNATVLKDIYVLNMDRRLDRMINLTKALHSAGLEFKRLSAVDGKMAMDGHVDQIWLHPKIKFDFKHWCTIKQESGAYGTTGCWLSHLHAYFNISENVRLHNEPDLPVMILEDDIFLAPNATYLINQAARSLPKDWEILFVGFKNDYCYNQVSPYLCRGSMLLDAHAYIVRNASVAEKLIQYSNRESPQVADIYWISLFKDILHIYLLRPSEVIRQNKGFSSDIQIQNDLDKKQDPLPSLALISASVPTEIAFSTNVASEIRTVEDLRILQRLLGSAQAEKSLDLVDADRTSFNINNIIETFLLGSVNGTFSKFIGSSPVFIYELDLHSSRLGTGLGNLLQAMCIANKLRLHFVAFGLYSRQQSSPLVDHSFFVRLDSPFARRLPTLQLHPQPVQDMESVAKVLQTAEGRLLLRPHPWKAPAAEACWAAPEIIVNSGDVLRRAVIDQALALAANYTSGLKSYSKFISGDEDYGPSALSELNVPAETFHVTPHNPNSLNLATHHHVVPGKHRRLVPDAAIVLRCSDILLRNDSDYGFLTFNAYPSLIPKTVKVIYILGEPLHQGPWGAACQELTRSFIDFLSPHYPNSTILVRRGFVFESLAMLLQAKTVICAPSLFCLWPAIANSYGNVYIATSRLVGDGAAPKLRGVHWLPVSLLQGVWRLNGTVDLAASTNSAARQVSSLLST